MLLEHPKVTSRIPESTSGHMKECVAAPEMQSIVSDFHNRACFAETCSSRLKSIADRLFGSHPEPGYGETQAPIAQGLIPELRDIGSRNDRALTEIDQLLSRIEAAI